MTINLGMGPRSAAALVITLFLVVFPLGTTTHAATPLSVASAVSTQDGSTQTVRGYVVGQPVSTTSVLTSSYPNDYALALADTAGETDTAKMLYVQIPSTFRSAWGLRTNPGLLGQRIDVTAQLSAYFSHPGAKNATAFATAGTTGPTDPTDPTDPTEPGEHDDYYGPALGKTGAPLKAALHDIIDDQTKLSYAQVWEALKDTDQDPANANNVLTLYSGLSLPKSGNGGDADDWNREHVWAKSHGDFGTATGPGTDVHHLRPEDVTVNSSRGNKDFDNGGAAVSQCSGCKGDSDSFEPRDAVKGDVARMIFYMAVRYNGDDGFRDLELNNLTNNGTNPFHGKVSVLLAWHAADPVSDFERRRNDRIFENWQGNRNPFIDHPEWATAIWN
ncbi:MAG: endonuclease [Nocardioides sp.]|uniref:endonuclease n=1 Tax=Nocardioides sp. TaxID=35761 RepID=UPI003F0A1396